MGAPVAKPERVPVPQQLIDELRTVFGDRLQTSEAICLQHGRSEAHFAPMPPDAVVYAHSTDDVVAAVKACSAHGVPIVAFGAGTSIEGKDRKSVV